jgi:hypothetical protein
MKTYAYNDKVVYFTNKAKNAISTKQAWYFYGKVKNLVKWYELTEDQMAQHLAYLPKLEKAIERKFGSTKTEAKASAPATKVAEPTTKLPEVVKPAVSKNGRTNNALRVKAVITNLEASIEILRAIK